MSSIITPENADGMIHHSRLLNLPLEIRRTVYQYLIPDAPISRLPWYYRTDRRDRIPKRQNHQPQSLDFLRVNKQIYYEFMEIWHGNRTIKHPWGCMYVNRSPPHLGHRLPSILHFARALQIRVPIRYEWSRTKYKNVAVLVNYLSLCPNRLREIEITLDIKYDYFKESLNCPGHGVKKFEEKLACVDDTIYYTLGSLWKLNGVRITRWKITVSKEAWKHDGQSQQFRTLLRRLAERGQVTVPSLTVNTMEPEFLGIYVEQETLGKRTFKLLANGREERPPQ
jgi:hypothetical protein